MDPSVWKGPKRPKTYQKATEARACLAIIQFVKDQAACSHCKKKHQNIKTDIFKFFLFSTSLHQNLIRNCQIQFSAHSLEWAGNALDCTKYRACTTFKNTLCNCDTMWSSAGKRTAFVICVWGVVRITWQSQQIKNPVCYEVHSHWVWETVTYIRMLQFFICPIYIFFKKSLRQTKV